MDLHLSQTHSPKLQVGPTYENNDIFENTKQTHLTGLHKVVITETRKSDKPSYITKEDMSGQRKRLQTEEQEEIIFENAKDEFIKADMSNTKIKHVHVDNFSFGNTKIFINDLVESSNVQQIIIDSKKNKEV